MAVRKSEIFPYPYSKWWSCSSSQSAVKLASNRFINRRNKHIDITYHCVRYVVNNKRVFISYIPASEMLADMMTEPLGRIKLEYICDLCESKLNSSA